VFPSNFALSNFERQKIRLFPIVFIFGAKYLDYGKKGVYPRFQA